MKSWCCVCSFCLCLCCYGQQDPQYTQYMYNLAMVNPAYVGATETANIGVLYRNQWTNFDGAPQTSTFYGNLMLNEQIGTGLSVIADQLGPIRETNVYADLAYTITLTNTQKLAFGIKAGVTFHDIGLKTLSVIDDNDPFFSESINTTTPNFGVGAFYFSDSYYVGLSVPNLFSATHLNQNGNKLGSETQHFFLTSGYVFYINDRLKLKPSFLVKSAFKAPLSFDFNTNILLYNKLEFGLSYRTGDSFSGLVNFALTEQLNIGYAYDAIRSDIREFAPSSHEVLIRYKFNPKIIRMLTPRFF